MKNQSFLVSNPLNNQLDFLIFFWRHDLVQNKLYLRRILNMVDKTLAVWVYDEFILILVEKISPVVV